MRRLILAALAIAILAGGCSSSESPVDVDPLTAPLPFGEVLVGLFGTDDVSQYRYRTERAAEQLLVDCMAAAGFEFIIDDPLPPEIPESLYASRAEVERDGFGILDRFRSWVETVDIDASRRDRNREYLSTLDSAGIRRYFEVLDGVAAEPGQIATNAGCRGSAATEAYEDWNLFLDELPNYASLAEERDTHPEWLAARTEWQSCMAAQGYDYPEPNAIRSDVERRMNETVAERFDAGGIPLFFDGESWRIDPEADEILASLRDFEIEVATANYECNQPLLAQFRSVEIQVQQGFVDRNRDKIDAVIAAVAAS